MKKVITLVLAIALVLTSVVAIAETVEAPAAPKGTPNINSFAKMTTKYNEGAGYITITLKGGKVDRLLVKWAEKGAEPEELAIDENGVATALAWGHKYMPGTEQKLGTSTIKDVNEEKIDSKVSLEKEYKTKDIWGNTEIVPSELVYKTHIDTKLGDRSTPAYFNETTNKDLKWSISAKEVKEGNKTKTVYTVKVPNAYDYGKEGPDEVKQYDEFETESLDYILKKYADRYPGDEINFVAPEKWTKEIKGTDIFGNVVKGTEDIKDPKGNTVFSDGYIQGYTVKTQVNKKLGTVIATPAQAAFLTVQGEWAVYYNRAGKIVGIEYFDGQF